MAAYSRLTTAVDDGLIDLGGGPITVMRPGADYDVSSLPRERVHITHGFKPFATAWENAGYPVSLTAPSNIAIVVVPRAKALARAMVAEACKTAMLVIVDGQKTDGVDSLFKECRKALGNLPSVPKDHGRIFWFAATDVFADWAAPPPTKGAHGFFTAPGVFSDGSVDAGSALLAETLPPKLPARMADLGAGWGYLAAPALARKGIQTLDMIEAEAVSVDCARLNVTDPRATILWGDAITHRPARAYDGIIMNPPFHTGRASDPALGRAFIAAASQQLAGHGKLWMVANRHLPYEQCLRDHFRNVEMIASNGAFKVFHATRPQKAPR